MFVSLRISRRQKLNKAEVVRIERNIKNCHLSKIYVLRIQTQELKPCYSFLDFTDYLLSALLLLINFRSVKIGNGFLI